MKKIIKPADKLIICLNNLIIPKLDYSNFNNERFSNKDNSKIDSDMEEKETVKNENYLEFDYNKKREGRLLKKIC